MICMVVEADIVVFARSEHCTTVPFKPMLTESIDNVETRGKAPRTEVLVKVNIAEDTSICFITRGAKREGTVIVLNRMSVSSSVISGSKRFSSGLI